MDKQWKVVPVEPTQKMKDAADADHTYFGHIATNKYKAMIAAAPQARSAPALLEARGLIEAASLDHAPDANLDRAAELLTAFAAAQPTGATDEREVIQAAKLLFNLTIADPTVKVRAPSAAKRDAITAAADAFRAALATAAVEPSKYAAELRSFADRYRFLRNRDLEAVSAGGVFAGLTPDNVVLNGADLDRAIDAAIATAKENSNG